MVRFLLRGAGKKTFGTFIEKEEKEVDSTPPPGTPGTDSRARLIAGRYGLP
jgi:hypothetical protein